MAMTDLGQAGLTVTAAGIGRYLVVLCVAAALGAALGLIRPVRRENVPRSWHVIQAQVLLSLVGAIIIVVVAESLARAFAIVGAAGLVRYRANIDDPKDAGVMLVALALGLTVGTGLYQFAVLACVFTIGLLWLLESLEPATRSRMQLTIATPDSAKLRTEIEHALLEKGVAYRIAYASENQLRYEVAVPLHVKIDKLTKAIKKLDENDTTSVDWDGAPAPASV
jgi:uncharacterized membrane protein YhiD involved in acid resistance